MCGWVDYTIHFHQQKQITWDLEFIKHTVVVEIQPRIPSRAPERLKQSELVWKGVHTNVGKLQMRASCSMIDLDLNLDNWEKSFIWQSCRFEETLGPVLMDLCLIILLNLSIDFNLLFCMRLNLCIAQALCWFISLHDSSLGDKKRHATCSLPFSYFL